MEDVSMEEAASVIRRRAQELRSESRSSVASLLVLVVVTALSVMALCLVATSPYRWVAACIVAGLVLLCGYAGYKTGSVRCESRWFALSYLATLEEMGVDLSASNSAADNERLPA